MDNKDVANVILSYIYVASSIVIIRFVFTFICSKQKLRCLEYRIALTGCLDYVDLRRR